MVVRAGITTGLMESGPSEANWFLARKAGEGETVTSDQFLLEETEFIYLFIYLGFYVAFNTVQVISRRVVGRAEETST